MKVKMRVNLGSADAAKLKLDHKECTEGMTVDVSDATAEVLVRRGFAELAEQKGIPTPPQQKGK